MSGYTSDPRIRPQELLPWIIAIAAFFLLPEYLSLGARVLVYILFALSLDLILGYAGIITLGHSAFFGLGAYTAGILGAKYGVTDPFLQLLAAALAAALLGISTGAVILRTKALTLLMLTLAITSIVLEIANKASSLTESTVNRETSSLRPPTASRACRSRRSSGSSSSISSAAPPSSTAWWRFSSAGCSSAACSTRRSAPC